MDGYLILMIIDGFLFKLKTETMLRQ